MQTFNDHSMGWNEFEAMVRTGMPHAQEIASGLSKSGLTVPSTITTLDSTQEEIADLRFYCVVHQAYRLGCLAEFLKLMNQSKLQSNWPEIRDCKKQQLELVNRCKMPSQIQDAQSMISSTTHYSGQTL